MRRVAWIAVLIGFGGLLQAPSAEGGSWPQFRGLKGTGVASPDVRLPAELGPETNVVWKTALPAGHSSPAIIGDRVYITGVRDQTLLTIGLDRTSGAVVWEAEAPHGPLEAVHSAGNCAQPTPATDGEHVVSLFGSCGLFCYDKQGKLLWKVPMGPFKNDFGAGSSPVIVDGRVILCQDHDTDSFIAAFNIRTGETVWKTDRSEFPRNYATPVIWEVNGRKQIVAAATLRIVGYDFETGKELWTVRGVARIVNMTPVVGDDGILYAACWSPGADEADRIQVLTFAEAAEKHDANKNGALEPDEVPEGPVKMRFSQIDRDKDGQISRDEYESMRRVFETARNVIVAIKPGGLGDITSTHVLWEQSKLLPYCPSPLYYNDHLFMVKNGGIMSCLDARTGKPAKQGRLAATGDYFSSPVAADGKVYLLSQSGKLTVISAVADWEELLTADFHEQAYATPAIVDGCLYLRTAGHLYCLGAAESK